MSDTTNIINIPAPTASVPGADPKMVMEMALGLEAPSIIAKRYGLTEATWAALKTNRPFILALSKAMKELKANGYTFRTKAAVLAEDLLADLYKRAKDSETGTSLLLQIAQWLTEMGNLKPKEAKDSGVGAGFSININLGDRSAVITHEAQPAALQEVRAVRPEVVDETGPPRLASGGGVGP